MNLKSVVAIAALKAAYKRLGITASVATDLSDSAIKTLGISYKAKLLPILMAIELGYFITEIDIEGNAFVQDGTGVEDGLIYAFLKGLSDDPSMVDQAVFAFNKVINEAPSVTHTEVFDFYKNIANEAANLSDSQTLAVGKAIPDASTAVDVYRYAATKALSEAPAMTDSFDYAADKEFAESPNLTDAIVNTFYKNPSETPNVTDATLFEKGKGFSDTVYATDDVDANASINDDQEMQFFKNTTNIASFTDSFARTVAFSRNFAENPSFTDTIASIYGTTFLETPSLTDAGSLRSQGYCDFTFFAEDFVGASRTF